MGGRVWIATDHTDMRRGMQGLALQMQEGLKCDPHGGDLFIFRGRRGDLAKILWQDGIGLSLYAKRLEPSRRCRWDFDLLKACFPGASITGAPNL
jgi:transposase